MLYKTILQEVQLLPASLQKEVLHYLLFLKTKTTEQAPTQAKPYFGCGEVKISMTEDFDEPLDDFKEYM